MDGHSCRGRRGGFSGHYSVGIIVARGLWLRLGNPAVTGTSRRHNATKTALWCSS